MNHMRVCRETPLIDSNLCGANLDFELRLEVSFYKAASSIRNE